MICRIPCVTVHVAAEFGEIAARSRLAAGQCPPKPSIQAVTQARTTPAPITVAPPDIAASLSWRWQSRCRYLPSLCRQRAISMFDGSVSSSSFRAVSTPATGKPFGSSRPICTSTLAWSQ